MIRLRIVDLVTSDGSQLPILDEGLVLLVGPNNAGKSQTLKDILSRAKDSNHVGITTTSVSFERTVGDSDELTDWLSTHVQSRTVDGRVRYHVPNWSDVEYSDVLGQWNAYGGKNPGVLTALFILFADGEARLTAGNTRPSIDVETEVAALAIQKLTQEPDLIKQIDRAAFSAFGLHVALDRFLVRNIALRLGEGRPSYESDDEGAPTKAYIGQLRARMKRLEEQGDGVRAFIGLLLEIVAGNHDVLLVDEPEAFLHPPQARALGRVLAEQAKTKQAFIATHSSDFVQGALEAGTPAMIVRLTRHENVNHAAVLSQEDLTALWSNPILKYSNILDGLFSDAVVLCEGDADCTYYEAVLREGIPLEGVVEQRQPQLLFAHCGGKDRMATVVAALRAVQIPVIVVPDFDVFRNRATLEKLVTLLGGNFDSIISDYNTVVDGLTQNVVPTRRIAMRDSLVRYLDGLPNEQLSRHEAEHLRAMIKVEDAWQNAKNSGQRALPGGDPSAACERLLAYLRAIGLMVVPVGEVERFVTTIGGHGPKWVAGVLASGLHRTPSPDAKAFVESIRDFATASS